MLNTKLNFIDFFNKNYFMRSIKYCLNKQLIEICMKSNEIARINEILLQFLPQHLHDFCQVASYTRGCLMLNVAAHWATELRYSLPDLRDNLRSKGKLYNLTSIRLQIKSQNSAGKHSKPNAKQTVLSSEAQAAIITAGKECTFKPLRHALLKLAGKGEDIIDED